MSAANIKVITQNIDGLHCKTRQKWNHREKLIEAHGRLGFYKCIPEVESDNDESDRDEQNTTQQRTVILGSRRKKQLLQSTTCNKSCTDSESDKSPCKYEFQESIPANEIEPPGVRTIISGIYTQDDDVGSSVDSDYALALELQNYLNGAGNGNQRRNPLNNFSQQSSSLLLNSPPQCPSCGRPVMPQALQFDETYHSHGHYQFELMVRTGLYQYHAADC
jgi:NAD-dependent SIR2 family protein deacetylase